MKRQSILARTLYIEERRSEKGVRFSDDAINHKRFSEWRALLNVDPTKPVFENRLFSAGLSETEALSLCGAVESSGFDQDPFWWAPIEEAIGLLPLDAQSLWQEVPISKEELKREGPLEALFPFVLTGIRRLGDKGAPLPQKDLFFILFHRLYEVSAQVFNAQAKKMVLLGQASASDDTVWSKLSSNLLDGEWVTLFETYPVLARIMGTAIEEYVGFFGEFAERFQKQKKVLEAEFFDGEHLGEILRIKGEISDLHQQGKSVLILTFEKDRKLVYKPRSLEIDVAWERCVSHFQTEKSSLKAPHACDFGSFGFVEYIDAKPCQSEEDLKTYYYNAGVLMALIYGLGGNDFHLENIIATGTNPVIIDTETLLIPVARYFGLGGIDETEEEDSLETLEGMLETSVIKMGFLPFWQAVGDQKRVDHGAFTGVKEGFHNLPTLEGNPASGYAFVGQIRDGFGDMGRHMIAHKEQLLHGENGISLFQNCKFRMLIRNSQVYGNLMSHMMQPAFLKDGFDFSLKAERLVNAFLYEAHPSIRKELLQVFQSERKAIERGDIPIFYGEPNGEGILDEEGLLFDRYFKKSATQNARERIEGLREEDLQIQLQIIERSLAAETRDLHDYKVEFTDGAALESTSLGFTDQELLLEVESIYDELMGHRFFAKNGDYSWLAEQYDLLRGGSNLGMMGPSLYDGLLGLAVFLSAFYKVTGRQDAYDAAAHCIKKATLVAEAMLPHAERYNIPLGYGSGLSGYIRGFSLSAKYLNAPEGFEIARKLLLQISEKMIRSDSVLDVLGGISGLVLALTSDSTWIDDKETGRQVRQILSWSGEYLLERQTEQTGNGHRVWKSYEANQSLTGLGHGLSGIATALLRIHGITGDDRFLKAAKEGLTYENSVFDEQASNWPDFRRDPRQKDTSTKQFMAGYCSGAPGVGLSRLDQFRRGVKDPKDSSLQLMILEDIKRADRFVRSIPAEQRNHLCCGSASRVDFLIEKGLVLGDEEAMAMARKKVSELIRGKQARGHYNFHAAGGTYYYNPTLFQGTAGVGYEILRVISPETIETVLL